MRYYQTSSQKKEKVVELVAESRELVVLSGVGAREYYRAEFGYRLRGDYMVGSL